MMILEKIYSRMTIYYLRLHKSNVSGRLGVRFGLDIPRLKHKVKFGDFVNLDRHVSIIMTETDQNTRTPYLVEFGSDIYLNRNVILDATAHIGIGDHVMIGPNTYITDHDHDFKGADVKEKIGTLPLDGIPTIIEENVWIGANVVVLKGVTIGENSIIGAGSIVTKSIPKNSIALGNPCRVLKPRI